MLPAWAAFEDFTVLTHTTTPRIEPGRVTCRGAEGETAYIDCDSVVVSGGWRRCQREALAYAGCAPEFCAAGDVEDCCSTLQQGNVSAFGKVNLL